MHETPSAAPMLEAEGIVKRFHGVPVLNGVGLRLHAGETAVLYGPNGAGKTTLLRILATLGRPDTGTLRIDGEDAEERNSVRAKMMYCGHATQLYDDLEPIENLRFFLSLYGRKADEAAMQAVLERVSLWRFRLFQVSTFSAGMRRRLSFARAMLLRPRLLLLDEPYTSLDTAGGDLVNEVIRELNAEGTAVLMSNHSPERVADLPHRRLRLQAGRLLDEDSDHVA